MSMYMWELFTRAFSRTTSGLAQSQFQPYYKLHSRLLHFRNFRLFISSTRGVMFTSFKPCLHFVGRWQTVQTQIRCHITTGASDQVMSSSKRLKWGNSIQHVWVNIKCENVYFLGRSFMKHYMYYFCFEYLFYVRMIIVCPSYGAVIEHYDNQSSGC